MRGARSLERDGQRGAKSLRRRRAAVLFARTPERTCRETSSAKERASDGLVLSGLKPRPTKTLGARPPPGESVASAFGAVQAAIPAARRKALRAVRFNGNKSPPFRCSADGCGMDQSRQGRASGPPRRTPTKKNGRRFVAPASRWRFWLRAAARKFAGRMPALRKPDGARRRQSVAAGLAQFETDYGRLQHVPASRDGKQRRQAAALHMGFAGRDNCGVDESRRGRASGPPRRTSAMKKRRRFVAPASCWRFWLRAAARKFAGRMPALRKPDGARRRCSAAVWLAQFENDYARLQHVLASRDGEQRRREAKHVR